MRTRFLTLALALFATFALATAQDARTILDRTASRLSGQGGLQAEFSMTSYVGSKVAGTASGTIYVQGNKFKLVSSQMQTWFDGKTQWSLMAGNGEVYVSNPTAAELQSVNPYYFLSISLVTTSSSWPRRMAAGRATKCASGRSGQDRTCAK